jgi:hypothetical protein
MGRIRPDANSQAVWRDGLREELCCPNSGILTVQNVEHVETRGSEAESVDIIGKRKRDSKQPVGEQCKLKSESGKLTQRKHGHTD